MDSPRRHWYFSNMAPQHSIPVFTLFGETGQFPDIIHCERFSARAPIHDWRIAAHRHSDMAQLFLITAGRVEAHVDGTAYSLGDDSFLFVPAQAVHSFVFQPMTEGLVTSFPMNVVSSINLGSETVRQRLARTFSGAATPDLISLANLIEATMAHVGPFRGQRALGLAHSLLASLAELVDGNERAFATGRLTALDALIAAHVGEGWTVSDYAAALLVSAGHLSRLCRNATGLGAAAYIEQYAMNEACRLLAFTALPVSEVGYRLGFSDPSYFSKRFRRMRNETPTAYRARFVA